MNAHYTAFGVLALLAGALASATPPLGLPPTPIPADNPQTPEKVALGDKLFHDKRFSATGEVGCVTCHDPALAFTDSPKRVSQGVRSLTGTRNAPTVINAAYMESMFWDGREPDLEHQSLQPPVNPVEGGLADHGPILSIVRTDPDYVQAFQAVFGKGGDAVTMKEVSQAIASFERTVVAGDSAFDRYTFGGDPGALTFQQKSGLNLFLNKGRCVSCHVIEQDQALFTDSEFHNIGVGINQVQDEVPRLASAFLAAKRQGADVDKTVLSDPKASELGRFAVSDDLSTVGAFKTPTLRNVALTAPYMHDGSLKTLREVVVHYNLGGKSKESDRINPYLSGGIRPLGLTDQEIDDLVAFMEALTSPQFARK
jgi:cytochrome c peroxidase